jgi:selenoprotein W-related protein
MRLKPQGRLDGAGAVDHLTDEVGSVALWPGATGGVFEVRVDGDLVWSRKERGRFPDIRELKQLLRDCIAPSRPLGHSDTR